MELVLLRMLSSDSALSLDEALLRLRVLVAGPASPVGASVKSLHMVMGGKRSRHNQGLRQSIIRGLLLLAPQGLQCTPYATRKCTSVQRHVLHALQPGASWSSSQICS